MVASFLCTASVHPHGDPPKGDARVVLAPSGTPTAPNQVSFLNACTCC